MKTRWKVAIVVAALVALGAVAGLAWFRSTPTAAWFRLQKAACAADVVTFDSGVDKSALARGFVSQAGLSGALAESQMLLKVQTIDDDVKHGSRGDICQWTYIDTAGEYVRFLTVQGQSLIARFQRFDGRWLLVEIDDERRPSP